MPDMAALNLTSDADIKLLFQEAIKACLKF